MKKTMILLAATAIAWAALFAAQTGPASVPYDPQKKYPVEALREDLKILWDMLDEGHAGFDRYTPKSVLKKTFEEAENGLSVPMTEFDYYLRLLPLIAEIKDGHTRAQLSPAAGAFLDSQPTVFPFGLRFLQGNAYIFRNLSGDRSLKEGAELVSINGIPVSEILSGLLPLIPNDAGIQTRKLRQLEFPATFGRLFALRFGGPDSFRIRFRPDQSQAIKEVTVPGIKGGDIVRILSERYPDAARRRPLYELSFRETTAVITIRGFADETEKGSLKYPDFLKSAFRTLEEKKTTNLIIDLRDNGGGEDEYGKLLFAYVMDKPFLYYAALESKKDHYDLFRFTGLTAKDTEELPKQVKKNARGWYDVLGHPNLGLQQPQSPGFRGKVVILINGLSFSATGETTSLFHYYKKATFFGEECGAGYYGNTSGFMVMATLPNTKIQVRIPLILYTMAVEGYPRDRGIIPDVPLTPTIDDFLAGRDPVLDGALQFLSKKEPESPLLESWKRYLQLKESSEFGLAWVSVGPVMNSARAACVQGDPTRPGTLYAAFGPGNLWKTTNNGLTWKPIFENRPTLGIGDVALAPSRPDTIWLGTGVDLKKPRNFTMPGTGVYRSDDGGATWRNMGLRDSYHIGKIDIHPTNPDIVFVAVHGHYWSTNRHRGLYRTTDGGITWEQVLYVNERTGANDVVMAPSDPTVVYATTWEDYPGVSGPSSGVWKSEDGGKNWRRLGGGLPEGPKTGRIGLAVSWTDPKKAYVLVDNLGRQENLAAEVYRTTDGGATWSRTHAEELFIFPRIGWYFADIYVNPRQDDEIYALGVRIAHSLDGGRTFSLVGGDVYHLFPSPAEPLHLDQCELWIDPGNPDHLAVGNDGGVYTSYDRGKTWLHHNNFPVGEFYDISVDNQDPYMIYGGTQDDASVFGPAREWNPRFPDAWRYVWLDPWSGGDGCYTFADPEDPTTVYFSSQNGAARRQDLKTGRSVSIMPSLPQGLKGKADYNFITPYFISPHNHRTLYHAGNYVFKSPNRGDSWQLISPELSRPADPERQSTAAGAIAESPLEPGVLYVGMDRGAFWVTLDDGRNWAERSKGLPKRYIRSICPSRFSRTRVYAAVPGINEDDLGCHLFVSEDHGLHWSSISNGLPDEVAYVILEDPTNENILYAGLLRGVYVSVDRGLNWALLGPELPAAAVSDLAIQEREMDLVASTYGRGIYVVNIKPIQAAYKNGPADRDILFDPPSARLPWTDDVHEVPSLRAVEKVPLTFYLTAPRAVTLSLQDAKGREIKSWSLAGKKGLNQVRWDLVTKTNDSPEPYFINYKEFAPAGEYEIRLAGEGIDLRARLKVVARSSPG